MALVDSLLSAIVRADGDALVMHVGERPYVVVGTQTINISTQDLNLDAMTNMLAQVLPADSHTQLEEFGAVEYKIPQQGDDRFAVVAARGGDDIWIEIRRRRVVQAAPAPEVRETQEAEAIQEPIAEAGAEPIPESIVEPSAPQEEPEPLVVVNARLEPVATGSEEDSPSHSVADIPNISEPEPQFAPVATSSEAEPPVETVIIQVVEPEQPAPVVVMQVVETAVPEPTTPDEPLIPIVVEVFAPSIFEPSVEDAPEPAFEPVTAVAPEPEVEVAVPPPIAAQVEQPAPAVFSEPVAAPVLAPQVESAEPPAIAAQIEQPTPMPIVEPISAPVLEPQVELTTSEPRFRPVAEPASMPIAASTSQPSPRPAATPVEQPSIAASVAPAEPAQPHVALPMTRTVRIEVPPRSSSRGSTRIDRLLRMASARGGSALFLTSESRPWIRVDGQLRYLDAEPSMSRADVEAAILEIAPESGHETIANGEPTEWLAEFGDVGRIRCTTFSDHRGPGVLLRMIATRAANADQLGLALEVQAFATEAQGLVLVAGPRSSGKSTMLSALVDLVNRQRGEFVITLERQIKLIHDNKAALVSQREVRGGADDAVVAARAALRESPDVLVVDDLVSPQMVPLLLTAASEGLLVFVSITAPSTAEAVQRFIELAPAESRKAVQSEMAESFRGAVAQVLLKKSGGGLVAAREVLLATSGAARVIADGQLDQLPLAVEGGRKYGMVSFTDVLVDYVRGGTVDVREAFRKTPDRNRLLDTLKRDGIDTSAVERLT